MNSPFVNHVPASGILYQSPPNSGSNDGAIPQAYDTAWPTYINLTSAQRSAFMAMPADLLRYAVIRHGYYLTLIAASVTAVEAPSIIGALSSEAQNTVNGIFATPPTVTARTQIDAALAAIAAANNTPFPT